MYILQAQHDSPFKDESDINSTIGKTGISANTVEENGLDRLRSES